MPRKNLVAKELYISSIMEIGVVRYEMHLNFLLLLYKNFSKYLDRYLLTKILGYFVK